MQLQLEQSFEADLREAVLDDVEHELVGKRDNLTHQMVQRVHDRLRAYGREFDYRVDPIIDSFELDAVERTDSGLSIRLGWTHEAAAYLEFGTSDHTIEGDPILSFVWEERHNPPEWVREQFDEEGDGYRVFLPEVEVAGVRETRAIRDALNWLRREVRR